MQGIGADELAVQIDLAEHLLRHRHFIRLDPDLGLGRDDRGLRGPARPAPAADAADYREKTPRPTGALSSPAARHAAPRPDRDIQPLSH